MSLAKPLKFIPLALGLALAAGAVSFTATPASAAPARNMLPAAGVGGLSNDLVQNVQWRRHGGYYGWRGGYYRRDRGGEIAAGVLGGLALGAIIGSAASAPPPVYYAPGPNYAADDWMAYCASKYRSFDPRSGTYLGYDGYRHPCR
jgi:hypothetical protein